MVLPFLPECSPAFCPAHSLAAEPRDPGLRTGSDLKVGMRHVEGGEFRMGSDGFYPEEAPVRSVRVDGFWIDEMPVTMIGPHRVVRLDC